MAAWKPVASPRPDPNDFEVNPSGPTPHIPPSLLPAPPQKDPQHTSRTAVGAADANDKLGPGGFGDGGFIQPDAPLAYQALFENEADATAPAREVVVTDTLDANLDLDTFELTEITFANNDQAIEIRPLA